jgi:hypothetical protein
MFRDYPPFIYLIFIGGEGAWSDLTSIIGVLISHRYHPIPLRILIESIVPITKNLDAFLLKNISPKTVIFHI